jgi:EAL domain-containing protein (putative c-di-GMP-specific phosphodiesterase class I)
VARVSVRSRPVPSALGQTVEVPRPDPSVVELVEIVRRQLRMDLAWLAKIDGDLLVLQVLAGDGDSFGLRPGATVRSGVSIYSHVLSGELPHLIPDVRADPLAAEMASVKELNIGSYAAVAIPDSDGTPYGMLGCLAHQPCPLRTRDSAFLRLAAEVLRDSVTDLRRLWRQRSRIWRETSEIIDAGGPKLVFQPMFDLASGEVVGIEALSRFPDTSRGPEGWFAAAASVGLEVELELVAIRSGLEFLHLLPRRAFLTVNASPRTIVESLVDALADTDLSRILIEVTERDRDAGSPAVMRNLNMLRQRGARIAVDDVGAGYSGLQQIVNTRPDVVKMDCFLTHHVDRDPARRAIANALVSVGREIGALVVAEGIETAEELHTVRDLGVAVGQGFYLGAPTCAAALPALLSRPTVPLGASSLPT